MTADDDPVGVGADVTTILEGFLEGCCAAEVAALSLLRFVALFSFLELFRVTTPGEAETGVVVVALMFEVLVLFDGASFTASLLLFIPTAARPISTGMDGSGGDIRSSLLWEVGGLAGGGENGTEWLTWV